MTALAPTALFIAAIMTFWFTNEMDEPTIKFMWLLVTGVLATGAIVEALRLATNPTGVVEWFRGLGD